MAKFDFDKPVASFSWYLQNGSADDKRGNRLHVGTGQKAQIYFGPESGEFIGKLKYVDDYIDLADGAKQHLSCPAQPVSINQAISVRNSRSLTSNLK